jgi:hypothetical protein
MHTGDLLTPSEAPIDRRRGLAFHESGHAVVMRALGIELGGATIGPANDYSGAVWGKDNNPKIFFNKDSVTNCTDNCSRARALAPPLGVDRAASGFSKWMVVAITQMITCLAGATAEHLLDGAPSKLSRHDEIIARKFAMSLVYCDSSVDSLLDYARTEARNILENHWSAVVAVAEVLLANGTVTAQQIDAAISDGLTRGAMKVEFARRSQWNAIVANAARSTQSS